MDTGAAPAGLQTSILAEETPDKLLIEPQAGQGFDQLTLLIGQMDSRVSVGPACCRSWSFHRRQHSTWLYLDESVGEVVAGSAGFPGPAGKVVAGRQDVGVLGAEFDE